MENRPQRITSGPWTGTAQLINGRRCRIGPKRWRINQLWDDERIIAERYCTRCVASRNREPSRNHANWQKMNQWGLAVSNLNCPNFGTDRREKRRIGGKPKSPQFGRRIAPLPQTMKNSGYNVCDLRPMKAHCRHTRPGKEIEKSRKLICRVNEESYDIESIFNEIYGES